MVIPVAKRFELHLDGMDTPEGFIDADRLVEIVGSMQEMATRLGRFETESAARGRPSRDLERVATLRIGLEKGSTTIIAERDSGAGALAFDLSDEEAVDRRFAELIDSVGADERPVWVSDLLARAAGKLVAALKQTAPSVEFKVDGEVRRTFKTKAIHRDTWNPATEDEPSHEVTFTGRLFAVNLHSHRLQVEDDIGTQVALLKVPNDREVGRFVGQYVTVTGVPGLDGNGRLTQINDADVVLATDPVGDQRVIPSISLTDILASAPGPTPGGIPGLTDTEVEAFLKAMR